MSALLSRASATASAAGAALLWALVPKCPLCAGAWLAAAGLGARQAAVLAPLLRPIALGLLITAALCGAIGIARRYRRRCCQSRIDARPADE